MIKTNKPKGKIHEPGDITLDRLDNDHNIILKCYYDKKHGGEYMVDVYCIELNRIFKKFEESRFVKLEVKKTK